MPQQSSITDDPITRGLGHTMTYQLTYWQLTLKDEQFILLVDHLLSVLQEAKQIAQERVASGSTSTPAPAKDT